MAEITFATAAELFDSTVDEQYQNTQMLKGICRERHGSRGKSIHVPVGGLGELSEIGFGSGDLPVSDLEETDVVITQKNYAFKTVIGGGARTLFAYDEIVEHARDHAMAAGRWADRVKLEAIFERSSWPTGGSVTPTKSFGQVLSTVGSSSGLNVAKLSAALDLLGDAGVNTAQNNMSGILAAVTRASLRNDQTFSSWDFNMKRPLMNDNLKGYLDIAFMTLGNKGDNALPYFDNGVSREYLLPIIDYNSMMIVFNREVETKIWFNQGQDRYELITTATAKAEVLQPEGIVLINAHSPAV